ncbi:MAG: AAA family ATPase, partial [candidate division WOR-3 bacterium]|nr:AAA family ATPase [candidate division WOR-3 bacterium]
MAIKKVKISNFKSFKDLEIELGKFNVLIGTNASGKSNFVQILKFLRDITNYHLDNAISMQGGIEYLRNLNIGSSQNLLVEVVSDQRYNTPPVRGKEKELIGMVTYETIYRFIIKFKRRGPGFEIVEDKLTQKVEFFKLGRRGRESEGGALSGNGEIVFSNDKEKISVDFLGFPPEVGPLKEHYIFLSFLKEAKLGPRTLLIERLPSFVMPPIFGEISIYDFDPKLPKKAIPITGRAEIEEDGNNLAIVLKNIIEDKEKKRKLFNLVKDLLPFVDELDVEKFADKSLLFKLREIYAKKQYLP